MFELLRSAEPFPCSLDDNLSHNYGVVILQDTQSKLLFAFCTECIKKMVRLDSSVPYEQVSFADVIEKYVK